MKTLILFILTFTTVSFAQNRSHYYYYYNNGPAYTNLITNPTFDTGITNWSQGGSYIAAYLSDYNNIGRIGVCRDSAVATAAFIWKVLGFTMENSATYVLIYDYYIPVTNTTTNGVKVRIIGGANPYLTDNKITGSWQTAIQTFTGSSAYTNLRFYQTATLPVTIGDLIYIDNVILYKQ